MRFIFTLLRHYSNIAVWATVVLRSRIPPRNLATNERDCPNIDDRAYSSVPLHSVAVISCINLSDVMSTWKRLLTCSCIQYPHTTTICGRTISRVGSTCDPETYPGRLSGSVETSNIERSTPSSERFVRITKQHPSAQQA